jgi:hypothetical protein
MERNGYQAVNSETTIFMKCRGTNFIFHGLFVDAMLHVSASESLRAEFMAKYTADFKVTGGGVMETFLGMEVEQTRDSIKFHLDHYIRDLLAEYKEYIMKDLRLKKVPISPGAILTNDICPAVPEPRTHKFYRSFVVKLQFAASWIRFETSFMVLQLARFCASAGAPQWAALHHLTEYLANPSIIRITYRRRRQTGDLLSGFADSDWGNSDSRRSTSCNLILYNKALIMW